MGEARSQPSGPVVTVQTSRLWLVSSPRHVHVWVGPDTIYDLPHAQALIEVVRERSGGRRIPVLVEIPAYANAELEVRRYWTSDEVRQVVSALAICVRSPVMRVIATFFLRITKPVVPCAVFTDHDEALRWVETHADG